MNSPPNKPHPSATLRTSGDPQPPELLDEQSRPDLRDTFGDLASRSSRISVAVRRIRLTGVDLSPKELSSVTSIHVLLGGLDGRAFLSEANFVMTDPTRRPTGLTLLALMQAGTIEVRVSPLMTWVPDFSIFADGSGPRAAILGFHWFQRPYPMAGPAFAMVIRGSQAKAVDRRFVGLWSGAHSVTPALVRILKGAAHPPSTSEGPNGHRAAVTGRGD